MCVKITKVGGRTERMESNLFFFFQVGFSKSSVCQNTGTPVMTFDATGRTALYYLEQTDCS